MNNKKMVYGIDILDYDRMDLRDRSKWLIETKFSLKELDKIVKNMIIGKGNFTEFSSKDLALEMEKQQYFKIIEDLTDVVSHTMECEVE
jgi:hypothetical protein